MKLEIFLDKFMNRFFKSENIVNSIKVCVGLEETILLINIKKSKSTTIDINKLTAAFDKIAETVISNYVSQSAKININGGVNNILEIIFHTYNQSTDSDVFFHLDM